MASDSTGEPPFDRGHVVWHDGLFRQSGRPWFVLSGQNHPFHGEEYLVAGVTTTARPGTIPLDDRAWDVGGLPRESHVSPWFLTTIKHDGIDRGVGAVRKTTIDDVREAVSTYLR